MGKKHTSLTERKTSLVKLFEGAVLIICLGVLALRSTYTESPATSTLNTAQPLTNEAMSIIISSVLLLTALVWFGVSFMRAGFKFRFTGIETGFLIFLIGGLIGLFVASNKRAAINNLVLLAGPMLTAVVLMHILNSQ